MSHARRMLSVLSLVVLGSLCATPSFGQIAQPTAPPSEATPVPPQVAPLEEKKLDQYATAYVAIEKIEREAAARLSAAKDPAAKHEIKTGAEEEIFHAVERSGLALIEFNQIAELAAQNDALRLKLAGKIDERRRD